MPKHLYTIPTGTTLPSTAGLPEGYPFLLVTSDETVPGVLHALQGSAFVAVSAGGASSLSHPTPVTFTALIPATPTPVAAQTIDAGFLGVDGAGFVVPATLSSGSTADTVKGQIRDISSQVIGDFTAGNLTVQLNLTPPGGSLSAFTPASANVPNNVVATSSAIDPYDATAVDNQMAAGALLTAQVVTSSTYVAAADVTLVFTVFFGDYAAPTGGDALEARLTDREHQLEAAE